MGLRDHGRVTVHRGPCGRLGVDGVGLAASATHLSVRPVDFEHLDAFTREEAEETGAVGTGPFDANLCDVAEPPQPRQDLTVTGARRGELGRVEDLAVVVEDAMRRAIATLPGELVRSVT